MRFAAPALLAGLAACGDAPDAAEPEASAGNENVAIVAPAPPLEPGASPDQPAAATAGEVASVDEIPVAMRGRWGLVAADCTSTRGDAKGLLVVGADDLRFYESRGRLAAPATHEDGRLEATFDFEGEGMHWQRGLVLELADGGRTLVRRETGPDAAPEAFRYQKCEAA